jgi:hypothetical protein|tara:strand:- start:1274 stop:1537 length:264 start_codon:yes stop_codon:yes gene_type:complete
MTTPSKEIVDAILSKDNFNANEKIYDALYGKSSEQLQARKVEIAKHFFDPDAEKTQDSETNLADETPEASVDNEEPEEQEPEETTEQ